MARRQLVSDLIKDVRVDTNEESEVSLEDNDILAMLNRGQEIATDILAKQYPDPLLKTTTYNISTDGPMFDIPKDAYSQRIQQVRVYRNGLNYYDVIPRFSYREAGKVDRGGAAGHPCGWLVESHQWRFAPKLIQGYSTAEVYYIVEPPELVIEDGRITSINESSFYVYINALRYDTELSQQIDSFDSYVNIIDGQTGVIKGSLQIKSIGDTKISFRNTPVRSSVYGRDITGAADIADLGISEDDYICSIKGSCIPFLKNPLAPLLVEYAVLRIRQRNLDPSDLEAQIYTKMEKEFGGLWSGREVKSRIARTNRNFGSRYGAQYFRRNRKTY